MGDGGWGGGAGFFNGSSFITVSRCAKGDSASFSQLQLSSPTQSTDTVQILVAYLHIKKIRKKLNQNLYIYLFTATWA
jgi:hypothetical protein